MRADRACEYLGPLDAPIEDRERPDSSVRQRPSDGSRRASRPEQDRGFPTRTEAELLDRTTEAFGVGVVALEPRAAADDRVYSADRSRSGRQAIEKRDDRLLVRHRDVQPGDVECPDAENGAAKIGRSHAQRHVDEVEPKRREGGVVHRR